MSLLLELTIKGQRSLEKTAILLQGLSRLQRRVDYYALDVSPRELYRTLDALQGKIGHDSVVKCHPLICTYEEGISWLRQASVLHGRDVYVLWLGSSMANEAPRENQRLLKAFKVASDARQIGKFTFLVGIDSCRDVDRICRAYDLGNGLSRQFVMNGITNVNTTMGYDVFDPEDWVFRGFWNSRQSRYETCLSPVCNVAVRIGPQTVHLEGGELVRLIYSQKWRREDLDRILQGTGLGITGCWSSSDVAYCTFSNPRPITPCKHVDMRSAVPNCVKIARRATHVGIRRGLHQ